MLEKLPDSSGSVLAFRLTGSLTEGDYSRVFVPEIERAIRDHGSVRLLMVVERFRGWSLKSPLADFRRGVEHSHSIDRIAVVGQGRWQKLVASLIAPFTKGEVRYFPRGRFDEALVWVSEGV